MLLCQPLWISRRRRTRAGEDLHGDQLIPGVPRLLRPDSIGPQHQRFPATAIVLVQFGEACVVCYIGECATTVVAIELVDHIRSTVMLDMFGPAERIGLTRHERAGGTDERIVFRSRP